MVSRYSVIQYVPNPVTDERINVGVLAFDEEQVQVRFLSAWDRVRCFGQRKDIAILKDFARQMEESAESGLLFPGDEADDRPKHERLLKLSRGWMNSIQFTDPKGSLEDVENLIEDMAQTYLLGVEHRIKPRDRQAAARFVTSHVRKLLQKQFGVDAAKELLRKDYELPGNRESHMFDVTVANGRPFFAAHGISFEVQTTDAVMGSLAWMIIDVKQSTPEFPLAVVTLPPKPEMTDHKRLMKLYEKQTHTYKGLGAQVLEEEQVDSWIAQQLEKIHVK